MCRGFMHLTYVAHIQILIVIFTYFLASFQSFTHFNFFRLKTLYNFVVHLETELGNFPSRNLLRQCLRVNKQQQVRKI